MSSTILGFRAGKEKALDWYKLGEAAWEKCPHTMAVSPVRLTECLPCSAERVSLTIILEVIACDSSKALSNI